MTPQEKAKQLVYDYVKITGTTDFDFTVQENTIANIKIGKQCALIVVLEMLLCDAIFHANNKETIDERNYWNQVKEEIEKL